MKRFLFNATLALSLVCMISCSSSKKVEKSPIKTFVMPCSQLVSGDGLLRAWASGKSDSEMSARKKAQLAASTDLAAMLERIVGALIEDKSVILNETNTGVSKSLFIEKSAISVKQSLKGAVIVCDQWTKDEATGQYTNYIVMELRGEDFVQVLFKELNKGKIKPINENRIKQVVNEQIEEIVGTP